MRKRLISDDEWKLICKIREAENCRKKVSYFTESEAFAAAIRLSSKVELGFAPSRPYKCNICTHWHLTTKPLNSKTKTKTEP